MAKRIDLNGGGTAPHYNKPSRPNHLRDNLIKAKKTIVLHENPRPVDPTPTPVPPEPEPTIVIDPAKITVIKLDSNLRRTNNVSYFESSADTSTYLRQASIDDRFDVIYGDDCGIAQINLEYNLNADSDHKAYDVIHDLHFGTDVKAIGQQAFQSSPIKHVTFEENSVTVIQEAAFDDCHDLENVIFPSSLQFIGPYAFKNTLSFADIIIPNTLQALGQACFYISTGFGEDMITRTLTFEVNGALRAIPNMAFGNNKFDTLRIPGFITSIGEAAFDMDIATSSTDRITGCVHLIIEDGVLSIGRMAFNHHMRMETIDLGNTITTIEDHAFNYAWLISSLTIPSTVTTLASNAFDDLGIEYNRRTGNTIQITINQAEDNITSANINIWKNSEYYTLTWTG